MTLLEQEALIGRTPMQSVNLAIAHLVAIRELLPTAEEINSAAAEGILQEVGIPNELKKLLITRHTAILNKNKKTEIELHDKIGLWLVANDPDKTISPAIWLEW